MREAWIDQVGQSVAEDFLGTYGLVSGRDPSGPVGLQRIVGPHTDHLITPQAMRIPPPPSGAG